MSLHIKTIETTYEGARLFATLSYARLEDGHAGVAVRLTKTKNRGKEMFLGMARLNAAGELVNYGSALTDSERSVIEKCISEALG